MSDKKFGLFWSGFATAVMVGIVMMCFVKFTSKEAQAQDALCPTAQDFQNRLDQVSFRFDGPVEVTFQPTKKGSSVTLVVDYVSILDGGVLIIPVENRGGTTFIYTNNWSMQTISRTNPNEK